MPKVRSRTASGVRPGAGGKDAGPAAIANSKRDTRDTILIILVLAAITTIAFWSVLGNQFVNYDDNRYILDNPNVLTGLTPANISWAFNIGYCGNWHPLTWISHMLDVTLFGLNPTSHHAVNLALHVACTILLFLMLSKVTKSRWRSAFVAALFAVHPLHVESVAWAAERKDVLSALFWMLAMLAYVRYTERPGIARYAPVMFLFALGLMAKPMLVTLPIVLLLLDYWPLGRMSDGKRNIWRLIPEKLPLLALSIGSSILTFIAQRRGDAVSSLDSIPLGLRIENALVSYAAYMGKMLYPKGLALLYPHPMHALPAWQVAGAALLLAGITAFAILNRTRRPYILVGWLWYVVTLIPVIGLVQVGRQAMADRYTYIPLIGLFVVIVWGVSESVGVPGSMGVWECGGKGVREKGSALAHSLVLPIVSGIVIIVLSVLTWVQVGYWKDNLTLFGHAVECTKDNYSMMNSLGLSLADEGKVDEAIAQYEKALEIEPAHVASRLNLGIALYDLGRVDEAIAQFRTAIEYDPKWPDSYFNLGKALDLQGATNEAEEQYRKALDLKPSYADAHVSLGNILSKRGDQDEAIRHYREALSVNALSVEARTNLATALHEKGDMSGAIQEYREVLRIKPDYGVAHSNLAILLYFQGDYAESWKEVRLAQDYGQAPNPGFLQALSGKMPEPGM